MVVRCDGCKAEQPGGLSDWFEIRRDLVVVGEQVELHFCSWPCLRDYAAEKAGPR